MCVSYASTSPWRGCHIAQVLRKGLGDAFEAIHFSLSPFVLIRDEPSASSLEERFTLCPHSVEFLLVGSRAQQALREANDNASAPAAAPARQDASPAAAPAPDGESCGAQVDTTGSDSDFNAAGEQKAAASPAAPTLAAAHAAGVARQAAAAEEEKVEEGDAPAALASAAAAEKAEVEEGSAPAASASAAASATAMAETDAVFASQVVGLLACAGFVGLSQRDVELARSLNDEYINQARVSGSV